ncbi:MAG: hypothetical protein IPG02_09985 [Ignavibacteria bacterium]|nr:hypothetical protein [Ignavibacteria bacterium]
MPITIDSYILKAKNFYMLEHFDSALSLADSFRHYVNLNKLISDFHKQNLFNFLKYFRAIIRLKVKINKQKSAEASCGTANLVKYTREEMAYRDDRRFAEIEMMLLSLVT